MTDKDIPKLTGTFDLDARDRLISELSFIFSTDKEIIDFLAGQVALWWQREIELEQARIPATFENLGRASNGEVQDD